MNPDWRQKVYRRKSPVREIIRNACLHAEDERASYADAHRDTPEGREAWAEYCEIRAYRLKRFGETPFERTMNDIKPTTLAELSSQPRP